MKRSYLVKLSAEEREQLRGLVETGKVAAYRRRHAQILLKADEAEDGPAWRDNQIAEAFDVHRTTVERLRKRFVEQGLAAALERQKRSRERSRVLDGAGEACLLIALACSEPPEGHARWTLNLLGDKLVELQVVESISHEKVRQVLDSLKPWQKAQWCIPPKQNAAFVCAMQAVLDVYQRPYDARYPVVCMDESSKQCVRETRPVLPMKPGQLERYDAEYERNGVAHLFMFCEPLTGQRQVRVTDNHAALEWAEGVRALVEDHYPQAEQITLVMDNLNTHTGASLYKAFSAEQAHRLLQKLQFCYTPKHGSCLNVAEIEFSVLSRQCLDRRLPDIDTVRDEATAWAKNRSRQNSRVDWHFTTDDARIKLKHLYPVVSD